MQFDNIKIKIKRGDIDTAAQMVGITSANAYKALERKGSKYHGKMVKALDLIISNRSKLIDRGLK